MILLALALTGFINDVQAQQQDTLYVWAGWQKGGVDTLTANPDRWVDVPIYLYGNQDVWLADICYPLGLHLPYFDNFDVESCSTYYPFTEWDIADFRNFNAEDSTGAAGPMPHNWISLSLIGWARFINFDSPWFHSVVPQKGFSFNVHAVNDPSLVGNTYWDAIGPGLDKIQGPANAGDTLGGSGYVVYQSFSPVIFEGGGYIVGSVTDSVGLPIEGVYVYLADSSKTDSTDNQGGYLLRNIPPGSYDVTFYHPDYFDTTISDISVTMYDSTYLDVEMRYRGSGYISGTVIDSSQTALEGVVVTIVNSPISDITDNEGNYILRNAPVGIQDVSFVHPAYEDTVINGINVIRDDTTFLDIILIYQRIDPENQPDKIGRLKNYPNPFNNWTTLEFYLTEPADVVVEIFDVLGRKIKQFARIRGSAGYNQVVWNGTNDDNNVVSSGVYYYRISDGNIRKSKSMTIIKFMD